MSDQIFFRLAVAPMSAYEAPDPGAPHMAKDDMLLKLLDELVGAWLETSTPIEIGSDLHKVRLLKEIPEWVEGAPSPRVRDLYQEVFLRDLWRAGSGAVEPGGSA